MSQTNEEMPDFGSNTNAKAPEINAKKRKVIGLRPTLLLLMQENQADEEQGSQIVADINNK